MRMPHFEQNRPRKRKLENCTCRGGAAATLDLSAASDATKVARIVTLKEFTNT